MRAKRKLSITIDNKVENTAKTRGFSKSKLAEEALKLWFKKNEEELMAKGYKEMVKEEQDFIELTLEAQREVLDE